MSDTTPSRHGGHVDPLDEGPQATPTGSLAPTVAAWVLAVAAAVPTGASFVIGPIGMACGLLAHTKGRRAGFTAAVAAGIGTAVGLSLQFLLLGGISGNG